VREYRNTIETSGKRGRNLGLKRYGVLKGDANCIGLKLAGVHIWYHGI